jgi:hypothetical protein
MRALVLASVLSALTLIPSSGHAGSLQVAAVSDLPPVAGIGSSRETYRGYVFDLSETAGHQNAAEMAGALRHQLDIVESVGLSQRVLTFFRTVPIVADEMACLNAKEPKARALACYGLPAGLRPAADEFTVWDSDKGQYANVSAVDLAHDTGRGVVMIRPLPIDPLRPVMLHEMLHAYHYEMLPNGFKNKAIAAHYQDAKSGQLYPADAYLMTNEPEFFAVTASVFLYGKDSQEPFTRANIKQKQPEYYRYLVWLFGFDPDRPPGAKPVASAD